MVVGTIGAGVLRDGLLWLGRSKGRYLRIFEGGKKMKKKKQWCVRYKVSWTSKTEEKLFDKKRDAKRFYQEAQILCVLAVMGRAEQ